VNDHEISRMAGLAKALFDALVERLSDAHQGEAVDGYSRAIGNGPNGLLDGRDSHAITRSMARDASAPLEPKLVIKVRIRRRR
jgi:hypothetical protein